METNTKMNVDLFTKFENNTINVLKDVDFNSISNNQLESWFNEINDNLLEIIKKSFPDAYIKIHYKVKNEQEFIMLIGVSLGIKITDSLYDIFRYELYGVNDDNYILTSKLDSENNIIFIYFYYKK